MGCENNAKYFPQPNVEGGRGRGGEVIINGIFRGETVAGPQSCLCPVLARFFENTTRKW